VRVWWWNVVTGGGAAESIIFLEVLNIPDMGVVTFRGELVLVFAYEGGLGSSGRNRPLFKMGLGVERKFECL
jgi:hypothetical protein